MLRRYYMIMCLLCIFIPFRVALADSTKSLIDKGNRAWLSGNYDDAIKSYDEAGVNDPESPYIYFNKGTALYKKGDYQGAIDAFEKAALKSKEPLMEAKSRFNLGNCTFSEATRQMDSDLSKAIDLCQKSVMHYQDALKLDPALKKAAENIEIVRLMMKNILDEMKKREEEAKKQEQQSKKNSEELQQLIKRQEEALEKNREQSKKKMTPAENKKVLDQQANEQKTISDDTQKLTDKLKGQTQQQKQGETNPALTHLNNAVKEQEAAEGNLRNLNSSEAEKNQDNAVKELKEALKPPDQNQDKQGGDRNKEEKKQGKQSGQGQQNQKNQENKDKGDKQPEKNDAAKKQDQQKDEKEASMQKQGEDPQDILNEETDNRKDREKQASGGYSDVDKDW
jgi:Ca-activated chloride channel homolog